MGSLQSSPWDKDLGSSGLFGRLYQGTRWGRQTKKGGKTIEGVLTSGHTVDKRGALCWRSSETTCRTHLRTVPPRGEAGGGLSIRSCPLSVKGRSVTASYLSLPCPCAIVLQQPQKTHRGKRQVSLEKKASRCMGIFHWSWSPSGWAEGMWVGS